MVISTATAQNIVEVEYTERAIASMHPNAQRLFGPKVRATVQSLISDAVVCGHKTVREYLTAQQWDGFEQWFNISFPYVLKAITINQNLKAA